ncbi:hypothetical protein PHYBOEH_002762 [Phytophthora boehmeriae]|uniref:C2H2-type domain-containing protein n=1 Tax=Phytophthora boehmeriae TaxID=109152 RepID=A0A8T1WQD9_9STRA|nr:hypothetical protein PHYBOEH_002762 [Phytophthora boehmeriae]
MKFHYGGAVKVCVVPGCGKTFSTTGNLNRHLKNHHRGLEAAATCSSPTPSKAIAAGSPTSAEAWVPTTTIDEFGIWNDTFSREFDFSETASDEDLMDALMSFLDDEM